MELALEIVDFATCIILVLCTITWWFMNKKKILVIQLILFILLLALWILQLVLEVSLGERYASTISLIGGAFANIVVIVKNIAQKRAEFKCEIEQND